MKASPATVAALLGLAYRAFAEDIVSQDGNTRADFGNGWLNMGSQTPWNPLDGIKEHCTSTGCSNVQFTVDTFVVTEDLQLTPGVITYDMDASFADDGDLGDMNGMVELAKAIMSSSGYEYRQGVKYSPGSDGGAVGIPAQPPDPEYIDQYKAPDKLQVRVESDDGSLIAELGFTAKVDLLDPEQEACKIITTVGSAVTKAVSGVLSGVFTLAGLACQ